MILTHYAATNMSQTLPEDCRVIADVQCPRQPQEIVVSGAVINGALACARLRIQQTRLEQEQYNVMALKEY